METQRWAVELIGDEARRAGQRGEVLGSPRGSRPLLSARDPRLKLRFSNDRSIGHAVTQIPRAHSGRASLGWGGGHSSPLRVIAHGDSTWMVGDLEGTES